MQITTRVHAVTGGHYTWDDANPSEVDFIRVWANAGAESVGHTTQTLAVPGFVFTEEFVAYIFESENPLEIYRRVARVTYQQLADAVSIVLGEVRSKQSMYHACQGRIVPKASLNEAIKKCYGVNLRRWHGSRE